MASYGLGYGLGKMGEGLSSGLLQGTMTGINLQMQKRKEDQALRIAQTKETGLERRHTEDLNLKKANADVDRLSKGIHLGIEAYKVTKDGKIANIIIKNNLGKDFPDVEWPGKEIDYIKIEGGDATYLIPKDSNVIKDIVEKVPLDSKADSFKAALDNKQILRIPRGPAPMTEYQKEKLPLEKKTVEAQESRAITAGRAETRKGVEEKKRAFKDKMVEEKWDTLTDDEQKRILGARIDPHDLTEKNILDVYANIMTDPAVKKALQPIAEQIMKKAVEKGGIGKDLDETTAKQILIEAGGDKEKARKLAKDRGYKF